MGHALPRVSAIYLIRDVKVVDLTVKRSLVVV